MKVPALIDPDVVAFPVLTGAGLIRAAEQIDWTVWRQICVVSGLQAQATSQKSPVNHKQRQIACGLSVN